MKGIYLKLSIIGYTLLVLFYNLPQNATLKNDYYAFEKIFMFIMLFIDYRNSSLTDKLFINYTRILIFLYVVFLLLSFIVDTVKAYSYVISTSSVVLSIFGSLIALYLEIRREKL